jgi:two-component system, OmpR family, alkaline phosphatase synthesis response regulator PhoP
MSIDKPLALIVEDEHDVAALFRHVIDMAGYRSEIAFHGQVAVERLSNSQPELVILDLDLPGVSGNDILKLIRKDERLSHTKVIVVTAHAHLANSLAAEPDITLFKPFSIEQFSDFIERFHLKIKYQTTIPLKDEPWDRVTGLYNQSFFINRLDFSLRQSKEIEQSSFAVIAISLDRDNEIKNQFNIKRWISILRETAKSLKTSVGPTDTLARFDQDTFYILIENLSEKTIPGMIATRIHKRLNKDLANLGNKVRFPIRIGVLLCDNRYENIAEILADAKQAQALPNARGNPARSSRTQPLSTRKQSFFHQGSSD